MQVVRIGRRGARVPGETPLHALPGVAARGHRRGRYHTVVTSALAVLVLLLLAAEAQAATPGTLLYAKRIGTGTSAAGALAVAAGPSGATVVAGWRRSASVPAGEVTMVAKYSAGGERMWLSMYTPTGGRAEAVAVDPSGNIYVAARLHGSSDDIGLLKYDAAGGLKWVRFYDGPASGGDWPAAIGFCGDGDVVVVGNSHAANGRVGIVVLKYLSDGGLAWAQPARFDSDPADADAGSVYGTSLGFGCSNIYVTGWSQQRVSGVWTDKAQTVKFSGAGGRIMWEQAYSAKRNPGSRANDIFVGDNWVVIVGSTRGSRETNALVVRYDLGGDQKYQREWGVDNGLRESFDDVVLDGAANVFVTGCRRLASPTRYQAVTMELDATLSSVEWKQTYLPRSRYAAGRSIARDGNGNVYVSGVRKNSAGDDDLLTIKYSPSGVRKWLRVWSGGGPADDKPNGLALGTRGGVYVAGRATAKGDFQQAVLLKYQR